MNATIKEQLQQQQQQDIIDSQAAHIRQLEAQLAAAQERERALQVGFTACIDTLWRYARLAARERGESETGQLMSANEAVGHFRAALAAAQQEGR